MSSRPGDDELPPDPFPGDPFAENTSAGVPDDQSSPPGTAPLNDPFSAGPLGAIFAQLQQAAASQGGINTDIARHLAVWGAAGGSVEPNLDPLERIRIEQLAARVAPLVEEVTGLSLHGSTDKLTVTGATKAEWAAEALVGLRPLLHGLAEGVTSMFDAATDGADDEDFAEAAGQLNALGLGMVPGGFAGLAKMIGPTVAGMQAGTLLGQLGAAALGTYDLPFPRPAGSRLLVVTTSVGAFADAWSLPGDHAPTQVVVRDLVTHSVLRLPFIADPLVELATAHAAAGRMDPDGFGELGTMGMAGGLLGGMGAMPTPSPDTFLAGSVTPEQERIRERLRLILVPVVATIDYLSSAIGARLLGDNRQVVEALRRRAIDGDDGTRLATRLLGFGLDQADHELGRSFVGGVLQRAGHDGLLALFAKGEHLPTSAELAAPGLWLSRIGLLD